MVSFQEEAQPIHQPGYLDMDTEKWTQNIHNVT